MGEEPVRVLLIDDDETLPVVLRRLLPRKDRSVELDWVDGYDDGIRIIMERRHDIYLVDYRLGGEDGTDLLREAIAKGCDAPIIMLTGMGGNSVDDAAMRAGAADFLQKHELNARSLDRAIRHAMARRASVDALRRSEERFQRAVDGTSDGLWEWDRGSGHLWLAPRFESMLGYDERELETTFDTFSALTHPSDRERVVTLLEGHLGSARPVDIECRMRRKDGRYRWYRVRARALRHGDGQASRMAGSIQDVTEQRRVRESLVRTQERFSLIEELATDGIWDLNLESGSAYYSPRWKAHLGYEEHELENDATTWRTLVHPDDLPLAERALDDHLERGRRFDPILRFRHKDGSTRWILMRGGSVSSRRGVQVRLVGTSTDVTRLKAAESALSESEAQRLALYDDAPEMYALIETNTNCIVDLNNTLARTLGVPKEDVVGMNIHGLHDPSCADRLRDLLGHLARSGEASESELMLRRRDGGVTHVSLDVARIEAGSKDHCRAIWRNVARRAA